MSDGSLHVGLHARDIHEPKALRLLLRPEQGDDKRRKRGRNEDGEHAIAPAPTGTLQDLGCDVGADEGVDDERSGGETGDETSPFEGRDVGDDN